MSANRALEIQCHAQVGGESRYVSGFHAVISVNNFWPKVTIETHDKKAAYSSAKRLSTGEAAKEIGSQQKKIFQSRNSGDLKAQISVSGGDGGSLSFKGFTIGSEYSLSAYQVSRTDTAIVEYAKISALNYGNGRMVEYKDEMTEPALEKGDSVATFILKCTQQLEKEADEAVSGGKSMDAQFRDKQKSVNKQLSKEFQKLLGASEKTMGWDKAIKAIASGECGDDSAIRTRVMGILTAGAGGFETTIMQLAEEFQCVYVPDWNTIGQLVNRKQLIKQKKSLSVTIISMHLSTSNGGTLFPIKYVAVSPPMRVPYMVNPETFYVVVPEENVKPGAAMLRTEGPLWIDTSGIMDDVDKEGKNRLEDRKKKQKASQGKSNVKKRKIKLEKADNTAKEVLMDYGKSIYVFQALAGSYAEIVTTLNLNVKVGKCYTVKNKGSGQEVLTGVLWEVRHNASTGGGQSPQASTTLVFHIIQMPGFTLPGI